MNNTCAIYINNSLKPAKIGDKVKKESIFSYSFPYIFKIHFSSQLRLYYHSELVHLKFSLQS